MPANSGALTGTIAHKHSALSADGGFLDDGVTGVTGTANGSLLMFDGSSVAQDLPVGNLNDVLTMGAAVPAWTPTSSSAVWTELADVTLGAAGQLSSGTFAAHDLLDIWILGANTVSQNTAVTFNNDGTANYKYNWTIDGAYAAIADDTELGINGGNNDHVSFIHLKTFYDTTTTDTGITWQGMNFVSGGGNTPISLSGWGYYSGSQITRVDKSQFGAVAIDQKIGARVIVLGAL